jgi:hypothetical protein
MLCKVHCLQQASVGTTTGVSSTFTGSGSAIDSPKSDSLASRNASSAVSYSESPSGSLDKSRFSTPIITVESIRQITEESMPGVFTATLKVMIDVDQQPAVECVSLDESVLNLLACFAKCYGKGHAQNRRGIIQFAASKVSRFRTFVTLRFAIATRSLSYISKPLSLCSDSNFW